MKQLYKFRTLSPQHRILLGKAFLYLSLIRVGFWLLSFHRFNTIMNWAIAHQPQKRSTSHVTEKHIIWAVETATHYLPGEAKCLARALTTKFIMHQYGFSCDLRIGVARLSSNTELTAHAWIEQEGKILIGGGGDLGLLTPLPSLDQFPN